MIRLIPLLSAVVMIVVSAAAWSSAPETMPVHWNLAGEVDRMGSRAEALGVMPLIGLALAALFAFLPRVAPRLRETSAFAWIAAATSAMLLVVHLVLVTHLGTTALWVALGGLHLVIGGALGKLRPNPFAGIRTPWTLLSKRAWVRTHRVGGWWFVGTGLLVTMAAPWDTLAGALCVALDVACVAVCAVYSYFVWRDDPERVEVAGGSPG